MMKKHPLRLLVCGERKFVLKELLIFLYDLMPNVVSLRITLIILISSSCRNDSKISVSFILLVVSKAEDISFVVIMISSCNF